MVFCGCLWGKMSKSSKTFFGNNEYRIDPKGRIPLPAEYHARLNLVDEDSTIVIVCSPYEEKPYLEIFSEEQWAKQEKRIKKMPEGRVRTYLLNNYIYSAKSIGLDSQNRIRLPQSMIDYAGINKDVVFVGVISNIRIWAAEKFAEERRSIHVTQEEIDAAFNQVSVLIPDDEEDE